MARTVRQVVDKAAKAAVASVDPEQILRLEGKIKTLQTQLRAAGKERLTASLVRTEIIKLVDQQPEPPQWLITNKASKRSPGVPTLFASDWHWGEVVDPSQIGGVNEFNLEIAHARARNLVNYAIDLLENHMVNPSYPGIVFVLGGDMVSGDIHDELVATNEVEIMPTVIDLFGVLIWCINVLAEHFGRVFVPCVTGNHGRATHKIRAKGRNYTSFDWLLYTILEKHFAADKRVVFSVPNGSDCAYNVFGHRYLLTHGDQFRGGDGMIGALGPIIRGDHKKRSRNTQVGQAYHTLLLGHWHQYIHLNRLIVNGSLKGYDEYAYQGNFPFEPPRQALWMTHPKWGITYSLPVFVEKGEAKRAAWVEWLK